MRFVLFAIAYLLSLAPLTGQNVLLLSGSLARTDPALLPQLENQLAEADRVIVLGDFLDRKAIINYRLGQPDRAINMLMNFNGPVDFIPGRKEWGDIRGNASDNLNFLSRELQEIDTAWNFYPSGGCPGPYVVEASENLTLIYVNSNWWLNEGEKPDAAECGMEDPAGFFVELAELLDQYDHTRVLLVSYHPFVSAGPHGGRLPGYVHLLPPVGGSFYAAYRKWIGGRHDLTNFYYESMREDFFQVLQEHPDVTVVSALEKSFQYTEKPLPQLIIGNLAAGGYVKKDLMENASRSAGFVVIRDDRGAGSANFYSPAQKTTVDLVPVIPPEAQEVVTGESFPAVTRAKATEKLHKDQKRPGLLGKNYRQEWETEIADVPVFDIDREKGGLTIVKQGGGMQTRSLRLEASDGKQFVLRSIEKFPEKAVPAELRNTIAADVVADQISASHPYGAFVIAPLAEAAGVYHTNPRLVYVPDDPRLGKYREDFGGGLYLFEERPDDDWRDQASFGNSKKIMSTADVIEKLENDGDHIIDQEQTVRSRLFDFWIGDWDRHDDQWRWARFKPDNENDIKFYQPIPRDRDQAFFWSDGSLLKASSRRWGQPKFQGFHEEIRDIGGLAFNARYFDRTFLTGADRQLWVTTARELKDRLTDDVIEQAIKSFPPKIYALHGEDIIRKLKQRRDDLVRYAEEYYLFISDVVTITGSDKEDLIEAVRKEDGSVDVEIWRIGGKDGERKYRYYQRTFIPGETREIRIFAFGDDDVIRITGKSDKSPLIRVIGGKGDDQLHDDSQVRGPGRKTILYDKPSTEINSGGEVRDRTSNRDIVNLYDRYAFRYNTTMPLVTGGYNPDDGIFLGGGLVATRHGFRKDPYKVRHTFMASVAPVSGSYLLSYDGHFVDVLGGWDLKVAADIFEPSFADFFYGLGNQTDFNEGAYDNDRQFYRVHYRQWILNPLLSQSSNNGKHTFEFGPSYRTVEIEEDENEDGDRFISQYAEYIGRGEDSEIPLLETHRHYAGLEIRYMMDLRDFAGFPKEGLYFDAGASIVRQIGDEENLMQALRSNLAIYSTVGGSLRTTVAFRVGGKVNFGEYEFYQAARLGGTSELRGYRKLRFAGEQAFYTNLELRTKILQFNSFLFPAECGILLFHDLGRVWESNPEEPVINPDKSVWHGGMGGGIWLAPLGRTVFSADYGVSNDNEKAFFVRFGFMF